VKQCCCNVLVSPAAGCVHLKQKESKETGSYQQVEATPLLRAMTITRKLDGIFFCLKLHCQLVVLLYTCMISFSFKVIVIIEWQPPLLLSWVGSEHGPPYFVVLLGLAFPLPYPLLSTHCLK